MIPLLFRHSLAAVILLAPTSLWAADARHGETLAKRWCTGCHLVGPEQSSATTDAPPFAVVAKMPNFDEGRLMFFLLDPHPKMPNMQLSRDDATDLAAYIATLGPHGSKPSQTPPVKSRRSDTMSEPGGWSSKPRERRADIKQATALR